MKLTIVRSMAVLAAVATMLASGAAPGAAQARGNWAVTYLDPVPARFSPGTPVTLGFWVLQHGTHPFSGDDIGEIALRFTDGKGGTHTFPGVELKEAAHYAAAIVLPEGIWRMQGVQGMFEPYEVGLLTVPGKLKLNPRPEDPPSTSVPLKDYWGAIRPPGFPAGKGTAQPPADPATGTVTDDAGASADTPAEIAATTAAVIEPGPPWWRSPVVALLLLLGAAGVLGAIRLRRR
jgi:hypothetical protein